MTAKYLHNMTAAEKTHGVRVRLTDAQRQSCQQATDSFTRTLIEAARDDSDPEYRDNARLLLSSRDVRW